VRYEYACLLGSSVGTALLKSLGRSRSSNAGSVSFPPASSSLKAAFGGKVHFEAGTLFGDLIRFVLIDRI
jgi:hypothetical protein